MRVGCGLVRSLPSGPAAVARTLHNKLRASSPIVRAASGPSATLQSADPSPLQTDGDWHRCYYAHPNSPCYQTRHCKSEQTEHLVPQACAQLMPDARMRCSGAHLYHTSDGSLPFPVPGQASPELPSASGMPTQNSRYVLPALPHPADVRPVSGCDV